jgi:hypothetical protein
MLTALPCLRALRHAPFAPRLIELLEIRFIVLSILRIKVRNVVMSEQELKEFVARMAELRAANTASPERAIAFLKEEGYLTEKGTVAEPYIHSVSEKR